jgi:hypothetical protein
MKQLIILLTLISIKCQSQNTNNSIGIGLGNISINTGNAFGSDFEINSPIYNSKGYFSDRTITRITSPYLYLGKRVYKKLILRLNGSFNYRTSYFDPTGWIIEPGPGFNYDKHIYNNVNYGKTLNTNIGLQYTFKVGKLNIYPAIEYASILSWNTYKNYYTLSPNTEKSYEEVYKEKNMWHSINVLCGVEYSIRKNISLSYEVGLYHEYFSPISRLSINVNY